jgi:hypothetical protein
MLEHSYTSSSDMKKIIYKLVQACGFFIILYIILMFAVALSTYFTPVLEKNIFTSPSVEARQYERTIDLDKWLKTKTEGPKGLMLGSSSMYANLDPVILGEQTGIDFFCAANSCQTITNSEYILEYCLNNTDKIDYLFLGIDPVVWHFDGHESSVEWIANSYNLRQSCSFKMAFCSADYLLWIYYTYFTIKNLMPFKKQYPDPTKGSGYEYRKGSLCFPDTDPQELVKEMKYAADMSESNYSSLQKIITICKSNNIELRLYLPKLLYTEPNRTFLNSIDAVIIDATTAPVDTSLYRDNHHLRCGGTKAYTIYTAEAFNKQR